jgi:methanogenic corrinoid protein MtbC1
MQEHLDVLKRALIGAELDLAIAATQRLLDQEVDPTVILEEGMAVAMFDLGEMWKRGEVFLPEVVASAAIFKACNELVEPALLAKKDPNAAANTLVLMCTVKGDLHDLGKNMVGAMLRTSGFDVHDMGKDVNAEKIMAAIDELHPQILGMSALLTTTVPYQETVIKRLVAAGMRERVKIMVGGAPVTPEWADKIGADGYANNAPEAVEVARKLVGLAQ